MDNSSAQHGFESAWSPHFAGASIRAYLTFIYSNRGALANDEGTELLLNKPESVEVLQKLRDAIFVDHVAPRPTENKTLPSSDILMLTGKVAITFDGMWRVIDFAKLHVGWRIGALPYFKEPTTIVLSVPEVIFSGTKHPEQAFEFYNILLIRNRSLSSRKDFGRL